MWDVVGATFKDIMDVMDTFKGVMDAFKDVGGATYIMGATFKGVTFDIGGATFMENRNSYFFIIKRLVGIIIVTIRDINDVFIVSDIITIIIIIIKK